MLRTHADSAADSVLLCLDTYEVLDGRCNAGLLYGSVRVRLTWVGEVLEELVEGITATNDESAQPMGRPLQAAGTALTVLLMAAGRPKS